MIDGKISGQDRTAHFSFCFSAARVRRSQFLPSRSLISDLAVGAMREFGYDAHVTIGSQGRHMVQPIAPGQTNEFRSL
jgi:hypothetical protein